MSQNNNIDKNDALVELLFQLADDDFILSYRGSEWLGLAPHIEEDVAFSSISQDTMGHAAIFYQLLENLGVGDANALAHRRTAVERRNAILLEKVNGPGHYLVEPRYDWAFAVVRNFFYVIFKKIRMNELKNCPYQPLAEAAVKVNLELYYHILHWSTWFKQLILAGDEARTRMESAIHQAAEDVEGLFQLGEKESEMIASGLICGSNDLKKKWIQLMKPIFEEVNMTLPTLEMKSGNGRKGEHTNDLVEALSTLKEVYELDPSAVW